MLVTDRNGRSITSTPVNVSVRLPDLLLAPAPSSGKLLLTWPADATSYRLESAFDLAGPWSNVPLGDTNSILITPVQRAQFFRLCTP